MELPDLTLYTVHKSVDDIDLEGFTVPGLRATFHRRVEAAPAGDRLATVGVYSYAGAELFMAWGYVDEQHCRWTAYRLPGDSPAPGGGPAWSAPHEGCPRVRRDGGALVLDTGAESLVLPGAGVPRQHPQGARPGAEAATGPDGSGGSPSVPPAAGESARRPAADQACPVPR